jgi:hypothetical protein
MAGFEVTLYGRIWVTPEDRFIVDSFVQMHRLRKELAEGVVKELEGNFGKAVWHEMSPAEVVKTIGVPADYSWQER